MELPLFRFAHVTICHIECHVFVHGLCSAHFFDTVHMWSPFLSTPSILLPCCGIKNCSAYLPFHPSASAAGLHHGDASASTSLMTEKRVAPLDEKKNL